MTGGTVKLIVLALLLQRCQAATESTSDADTQDATDNTVYFKKEASIDKDTLSGMDCHLKNIDFCYAGLMGASTRLLPENDAQFEARCDEMKAATSCMRVFNQNCQSERFLAMMGPLGDSFGENNQASRIAKLVGGENLLHQRVDNGLENIIGKTTSSANITLETLLNVCEPKAKGNPANTRLRSFMFRLGKCINQRAPKLQPCIDDMATTFLLFAQSRKIQIKPVCCAVSRFQSCMYSAMDGACGITSFKTVMEQFANASPMGSMNSMQRICRGANDYRSKECREILPPSGMKLSDVAKKSAKGKSRLANALDLMSLSPVMHES